MEKWEIRVSDWINLQGDRQQNPRKRGDIRVKRSSTISWRELEIFACPQKCEFLMEINNDQGTIIWEKVTFKGNNIV